MQVNAKMWVSAVLVVLVSVFGVGEATVCGQDELDVDACIAGIQAQMVSLDAFWYGNTYLGRCPTQAEWFTPECFSLISDASMYPASIQSLTGITPATIDRVLSVTYDNPAGTYTGCDNVYVQSEDLTVKVDPLSTDTHTSWEFRNFPTLSWDTESGKQYMVVKIDTGYNIIHAMYINVQGNDVLGTGTAIREFFGTAQGFDSPNPYMWMVFEQTSNNMNGISDTFLNAINSDEGGRNPMVYGQLANDDGFIGPLATAVILTRLDPYGEFFLNDLNDPPVISNCVPFIEAEYVSETYNTLSILPTSPDFSIFVSVEITNAAYTFDFCCETTYPARTFNIDPLGDGNVAAAELRSDNGRAVILSMNQLFPDPSVDFAGKFYTMIEIAPYMPSAFTDFGTNTRPLVLWMTINNVADSTGRLGSGTTVLDYVPAIPPTADKQTYFFLIYEQTGSMATPDLSAYSNDACGLPGRCVFDITSFVSAMNLGSIKGLTWMTVERNDDNYCDMVDGLNADDVCDLTYSVDACTAAAPIYTSTLWVMLVGAVVSTLLR